MTQSTSPHPHYHFDHLGVHDRAQTVMDDLGIEDAMLARVVRVDRGLPLVTSATGTFRAQPANHLVKAAKNDAMSRAAVGDWVALVHPESHEMPIIEAILPREGSFTRKDPGDDAGEQVVIANIDVVFVVQALSGQGVNIARLERELVLAFESGAEPYIVLTKADLCDDIDAQVATAQTVSAGVPVIVESAITGLGVDEVRRLVPRGVTAAMIGASGVGKSTLINRLVGNEIQATASVRDVDDKGRHTTVAREIVELPQGGVLIDTPGMRAIALWRAETGLQRAFPEISDAADSCKFSDCSHQGEPGCAIGKGVEEGAINPERVNRYHALAIELVELEKRREEKQWRAKEERAPRKGHNPKKRSR